MDDLVPFFMCVGFLFFVVPTIICIVLAVRLSGLRGRVTQLEGRLEDLTRELLTRTRPAAAHPATPETHAAKAPAAQTATVIQVPAAVHPPVAHVQATLHGVPIPLEPKRSTHAAPPPMPHPAAAPVAAHATAEQHVGHAGEVQPKEVRSSPATTGPASAAAHAAPVHAAAMATTPVVPAPLKPAAPAMPAAPHVPAVTPGAPTSAAPPVAPQGATPPIPRHEAAPLPAISHVTSPAVHGAPVPVTAAGPVAPAAPAIASHTATPAAAAPRPAVSPATAPTAQVAHPAAGGSGPPPHQPASAGPASAPRPAAKKRSLESHFWRGAVVIGAISIAIAAILLVKMGIEKGVFGPLQRDWASALGALALIGVGQWWRRREGFWSQGLIGAGIVAMFAAVFAATTMHRFLLPLHGFVFLGLTTAGAVAMSLQDWSGGTAAAGGPGAKARGGMLIATLGLIGGFLTPILVNSGRDDVPGLFGYLILLHVGLIFATRVRGWTILAAASVVLSSLWLIFWIVFKWNPVAGSPDGSILGLFMLGMVASLVISTLSQPEKWRGGRSGLAAMTLTWLAVGLGMLSACLLIGKSHYDNFQWAFFAVLVAGAFVLARLRPIYEAMAWLASVMVLVMLTVWGVGIALMPVAGIEAAAGAGNVLEEHLRFQAWLLGFGVATVVAAFACLWKSAAPVRWAVLANLLALAYVGVAYWLLPSVPRGDAWAYLPLAAAGGLAVLMAPLVLRRDRIVTGEACLTVYGHGILALLLMTAPMGLHGGTLTAAWAGLLPVVALAMWRLKLPGLIAGFMVAAFLVAARALMLGTVFEAGGAGRSLWWNPVVWSYGATLLSMGLAGWFLEKSGELPERWRGTLPGPKALAAMMQVGAAVSAFLLLTLEVRWGFHQGHLDANSALLVERGTFAIGWLLLAAAVIWMGKQIQRPVLLVCGEVIAILGLIYAVAALVIITNPLWWQWQGAVDQVGRMPVFNLLIYAYGMPAALCALVAYVIARSDPERGALAKAAGAAGVILLFTMVSLQVRQGFAGTQLTLEPAGISFRELATYAVAWLCLGVVCLAIGRRFAKDVLWRAGNLLCTGGAAYAILVVGIVMSPMLHHVWVGDWKVLNDLLYAYGAPILLCGVAAWVADTRSSRIFGALPDGGDQAFAGAWHLGSAMRAGVLVLLFILVTTEVRQGFQGGYLNVDHITFFERNSYPIAWLVLAGLLLMGAYASKSSAARRGGMMIAGIGMVFVLLVDTLLLNPLWTGESIRGMVVFNDLLFAFGVPAALCAGIVWLMARNDPAHAGFTRGVGIVGLILLSVLVSLEVRQGYAGAQLSLGNVPVHFTESATYTVAWMGLGVACLAVGRRFGLGIVRQAGVVLTGGGLAYALGVVGVVLNPVLHHAWVGDGKVVNWVLYAYGVPVVLAGVAAWVIDARSARIFGRRGEAERTESWNFGGALRTGILVMLFILVTTEVRQGFQGGYLDAMQMTFRERGIYPVAWLVLAGVLLAAGYRFGSRAARRGGMVIAGIGMGFVLAVNALVLNPLWSGETIRGLVVFNDLLLAFGVPAALCGVIAVLMQRKDAAQGPYARGTGMVALILLTVLVTLEVRQGFAGERLGIGLHPLMFTEIATYAVVWMSLGAVCLAVGKRWQVAMVQKAGAILAVDGLLYAVGVVGILANPILHNWWVGDWRILNVVLYGFGVPAALAGVTAWIVAARAARIFGPWLGDNERVLGDWSVGRVMRAGVVVLLFLLVGMEVRQWFQGDHLNRLAMGFMERGSYGVMWFGLAGVLLAVGHGLKDPAGRRGGLIVAGIALGWAVVICAGIMNPLWTRESVGAMRIVNGLLYAYGVPAAAAGLLGWMLWERRPWVTGAGGGIMERMYAWVAGIASLVLVFVLVTLEVQQFFRGDRMGWGPSPEGSMAGEFVTYSLAWAILGIVCLAAGIWRKSLILRWASLVMMLITIPKVFLVDMSDLHDMQRVLSFAGLGMSLMALAFVYQRFVFRRPAVAAAAAEPTVESTLKV